MPTDPRPKRLSRAEMEAEFGKGRTIVHQGKHITKIEELPNDEDIVGSDIEELRTIEAGMAASAREFEQRRQEIQRRIGEAEKARQTAPPERKPTETAPDPDRPVVFGMTESRDQPKKGR